MQNLFFLIFLLIERTGSDEGDDEYEDNTVESFSNQISKEISPPKQMVPIPVSSEDEVSQLTFEIKQNS